MERPLAKGWRGERGKGDENCRVWTSLTSRLSISCWSLDSGWKQGCGLVPQHTGCKQRSCSGKEEEEEEEGSNTAEEEEWWARSREEFKEKKEREV